MRIISEKSFVDYGLVKKEQKKERVQVSETQPSQKEIRAVIAEGKGLSDARKARIAQKNRIAAAKNLASVSKPGFGFRNQSSIVLSTKTTDISPKIMDSVVRRQLAASMR
ncbi:MAG: hypothetical protein LiPW41_270 [Parcubacteria group bacterium LiPW_41]|nr:MAG: hypothetical protein LiPW41_270 [Parcubacteria group bacterium LiPW_41]